MGEMTAGYVLLEDSEEAEHKQSEPGGGFVGFIIFLLILKFIASLF